MREINGRPMAPLTEGNDAEDKLMLSIYSSGAIFNKHNHNDKENVCLYKLIIRRMYE